MPKAFIKDFKGIYTNLDDNDKSLETFNQSVNFAHEHGLCEYIRRDLVELSAPDLESYFGEEGWGWETGIQTILTNDANATTTIINQWKVLVMIALKTTGSTYERAVFMYDYTADHWYEFSKEVRGGYTEGGSDTVIDMSRSFLTGTTVGKTFFMEEDGALKIYMPHDSFWLGRITREIYNRNKPEPDEPLNVDQFYLDRLVENFEKNKSGLQNVDYPNEGEWQSCRTDKRLGMAASFSITEDQAFAPEEKTLTTVSWLAVTAQDVPENEWQYYQWFWQDPDGNKITWKLPNEMVEDQGLRHCAYISDSNGYLVIPREYEDYYIPDGTTIKAISVDQPGGVVTSPAILKMNPPFGIGDTHYPTTPYAEYYRLTKAVFDAQTWKFIGTGALTDIGFDPSNQEYNILFIN